MVEKTLACIVLHKFLSRVILSKCVLFPSLKFIPLVNNSFRIYSSWQRYTSTGWQYVLYQKVERFDKMTPTQINLLPISEGWLKDGEKTLDHTTQKKPPLTVCSSHSYKVRLL